jgi:hypothetical protein
LVTETKRCSISPGVRSSGNRPSTRDGLFVYFAASSPTSPSSVAEKNIVWRLLGSRRTILSTCGRKPMSSMRSASSRTRILICDRVDHPALDEVLEPAGRRDEHVRGLRALALRAERDAAVDGDDAKLLRAGERLELLRDLDAELARRDEHERRRARVVGLVRSTIGSANASVLPEPVGDRARMSSRRAVGQRERLDAERCVDVASCERVDHGCGHAELGER